MESVTLRKNKEAELIKRASSEFEGMMTFGITMLKVGIAITVAGLIGRIILQALFK